jgi:predicted Ser/Thr protein kinase
VIFIVSIFITKKKKMMLFLLFNIGIAIGCEFGKPSEVTSFDIPYFEEGTYLGLQHPATCGGYLKNVTYCYLNIIAYQQPNEGCLSIWEPQANNQYEKILSSEIGIGISETCSGTLKNGCGIHRRTSRIEINHDMGANPARDMFCESHCFYNTTILVPYGSVMGVTFTNIDTEKGQLLARHTSQTEGVCVGYDFIYTGNAPSKVTCPNPGTNTTTTLLAGAEIEPITCGSPVNPPYSSSNRKPISYYGEVVTYTCLEGFSLRGDSKLTCSENGQWSGFVPHCDVKNCTAPNVLENGNHTRVSGNYNNGSVVTFFCNAGFNIQGSISARCFRGQWIYLQQPPNCERFCNYPGAPINGETIPEQSSYSVGEFIEYSCMDNYTLSNDISRICLENGSWSNSEPMCNDDNQSGSSSGGYALFLLFLLILVLIVATTIVVAIIGIRKTRPKKYYMDKMKMSSLDKENQEKRSSLYDEVNAYSTPDGDNNVRSNFVSAYNPLSVNAARSTPSNTIESAKAYENLKRLSVSFGYEMDQDLFEEPLESEKPYWEPSAIEEELYLQLDYIKMRRIPVKNLKLKEILGKGQFAVVHKGKVDEELVAVKILKDEATEEDKIKFLQEAAVIGQFSHVNVIKLHGVVTDAFKLMIVMEYMPGGDLHGWLLNQKQQAAQVNRNTLLNFSRHVCLGMTYLSAKGFVHRDLAARNVLINDKNICKIADFGMSHDLVDEAYYFGKEGGLIPVKWTAPEALKYRKYSSASDVWSYGCVLYEIWSLGHKPYESTLTKDLVKLITSGSRLAPPPGCSQQMYDIMFKCWHPEAKERPTFYEIMLYLMESDEVLMEIPDKELSSHPQAGTLGADLAAGEYMYQEIQTRYVTKKHDTH